MAGCGQAVVASGMAIGKWREGLAGKGWNEFGEKQAKHKAAKKANGFESTQMAFPLMASSRKGPKVGWPEMDKIVAIIAGRMG